MNRGRASAAFKTRPSTLTFFSFFLACSFALLAVPHSAHAETILTAVGGVPQFNTALTAAGNPHIVEEDLYIRDGSLSFGPGVVVKFKTGTLLEVHADVRVTSTATEVEPVYFTSYQDDSVGGDSNGDAATTVPSPGDWKYALFGSGSMVTPGNLNLQHLRARYGGADTLGNPIDAALFLNFQRSNRSQGIAYILSDIEVSKSASVGVNVRIADRNTLTIGHSSFYDNASYALYKAPVLDLFGFEVSGLLTAVDNWWGHASGPLHSTFNPTGLGNEITGPNLTISPWLTADPFAPPPPQYAECCSSVVFLPGLEGSELFFGSNTLWPPTLFDVSGDLQKLSFDANGTANTPDVTVGGILNTFDIKAAAGPTLKSVPIYEGFSAFMNGLTVVNSDTGTSTIREWKALSYDWRLAPEEIVTNGVRTLDGNVNILEEVESLAARSDTGKVTIVGHSYGGLIGKALIKALAEQGKVELIDSFVMVGSPQLGTPQAIGGLLHGEGSAISGKIFGVTIPLVTKNQVRDLGLNTVGAYHLLPSREYFNQVVDPVLKFDAAAPFGAEWISVFGDAGVKIYSDMVSFLSADLVPHPAPSALFPHYPAILNSSLITSADSFHSEYDSYAVPSSIRVVQVAGWGLDTIKGFKYVNRHDGLAYDLLVTSEGDQTVVYPSAVASVGEKYYFNLDLFQDIQRDIGHSNFLSSIPALDVIRKIIYDGFVENISYITEIRPNLTDIEDKLLVSTHSPVTLGMTDSDGRFTGITPGQNPNADILLTTNEIPGSNFFTFGDGNYISLPKSGTYSVNLSGTGEGPTTVLVEGLAGGVQSTIAAYTDFSVTAATQASLVVVDGAPAEITIDQNGDGTVDTYVSTDDGALSLDKLLVNLKTAVNSLVVTEKLKKDLLKRIEKIEKKIIKQKNKKAGKAIMNLEKKITRKAGKGKIPENDAQIILDLLTQIENAL